MAERLRIFEEFSSGAGAGTLADVEEFLGTEDLVREYHAGADEEGGIMVRVTLKKFSFLAARDIFLRLSEYMRRSYYNVYTNEETEEGVRYLYLTGREGWDGIRIEIIFS